MDFALSFLLTLAVAAVGPYTSGLLMGHSRYRGSLQNLLQLPGRDRDTIAQQTKSTLERSKLWEMFLGGIVTLASASLPLFLFSETFFILAPMGIALSLGMNRIFRELPRIVKKADSKAIDKAIRFHLEKSKQIKVEGLMQGLTLVNTEQSQLRGVRALTKWSSPWAIRYLAEVEKSTYREVRNLASRGKRAGDYLLENDLNPDIPTLQSLILRTSYWERYAQGLLAEERLLLTGPGEDIHDGFHKAFQNQAKLVRDFPDVFCMSCHTRGEIEQYHDWEFVRCRTCKESENVIGQVAVVEGRIGPQVKPQLNSVVLPINLWDDGRQSAQAIEMDRLRVQGGADINYDWAVSACIEATRNRFPEENIQLEVVVDPGIVLAANTHSLLRSISAS